MMKEKTVVLTKKSTNCGGPTFSKNYPLYTSLFSREYGFWVDFVLPKAYPFVFFSGGKKVNHEALF
jgi:hypothetical protein